VERALQWSEKCFGENLLSEGFQCEWADGVLKVGHTLYTNVLYFRALGDMGNVARQRYIGNLLKEHLWNGTFFEDWEDYKRQDYFSTQANMLAIVLGWHPRGNRNPFLSLPGGIVCVTGHSKRTTQHIHFGGYQSCSMCLSMADYHNRGRLWLQPGITYALALWISGCKKEAREFLSRISKQIVRYEGVYEVYEKDGTPVNRPLYRSEGPFAWSAGLFLHACDKLYEGKYRDNTCDDIEHKSA
jgi:hypothetical protein